MRPGMPHRTVRGRIAYTSKKPEMLDRPRGREWFTARYPDHFGATVSAGGARIALVDTLGDPERPLSRDGVIAKALALFAWGRLSEAQAERGVALALDGDDAVAIVGWLEDTL